MSFCTFKHTHTHIHLCTYMRRPMFVQICAPRWRKCTRKFGASLSPLPRPSTKNNALYVRTRHADVCVFVCAFLLSVDDVSSFPAENSRSTIICHQRKSSKRHIKQIECLKEQPHTRTHAQPDTNIDMCVHLWWFSVTNGDFGVFVQINIYSCSSLGSPFGRHLEAFKCLCI